MLAAVLSPAAWGQGQGLDVNRRGLPAARWTGPAFSKTTSKQAACQAPGVPCGPTSLIQSCGSSPGMVQTQSSEEAPVIHPGLF